MAATELCCFQCVCLLLFLVASTETHSVSHSSRMVTVPIGRKVFLEPRDLYVIDGFPLKDFCKVEVIRTEPMSQRVGTLEPKIFDCDFARNSVYYEHYGSPMLDKDLVKLRVMNFADNKTMQETVDVTVRVLKHQSPCATVMRHLVVREFFGVSRPIDQRVLKLNVANDVPCRVHLYSPAPGVGSGPHHGRIVTGRWPRQSLDLRDGRFTSTCTEFLFLGLRYEHLKPPTPDEDSVVLLVETFNLGNLSLPSNARREWVHLRVTIEPALPNILPTVSPSSTLTFHVDHDTSTLLAPSILSAVDEESSPKGIVFNLTKGFSPFQGYLYNIGDPTRPVKSFTQEDLDSNRIAYISPDVLQYDRLSFQIWFDIWDDNFGVSESPAVLQVVLRRSPAPRRPRVSVRNGLILLEGQSRPILSNHLQLNAVSPLARVSVQFMVVGGPHHGRIVVEGQPRRTFAWSAIERRLVVYEHDGSDTTLDALHLRLSDDPDSIQIKFPIRIIPKDDTPPTLFINLLLQVDNGGAVLLSPANLKAVDSDSSPEMVWCVVVRLPRYGRILRRDPWTSSVTSVNNFTQSDINEGALFYQHDGSEVYGDEFEIILQDGHSPSPNVSPPYTVNVVVTPVDGDPPRPALGATFSGVVFETSVLLLNCSMLKYAYRGGQDKDIFIDVTTPPCRVTGSICRHESADAGKLVLLHKDTDFGNKTDLIRLPEANVFSQEQVSLGRVAYIPPLTDVGSTLLPVRFNFHVRSRSGTHLYGQRFNITVLPVNNKAPVLYTGVLVVVAGNTSLVTTHALSVSDEDTPMEDLKISLQSLPQFGVLMIDNIPIGAYQNFTMNNVISSKVTYAHRGTRSMNDRISVSVSDRVHTVRGSVLIHILPVKNDTSIVTVDQSSSSRLTVNEGDDIVITSDVLMASVDNVDYDDNARFMIVRNPNLGIVEVDGKADDIFTQNDLMLGKVKYVHGGNEIGMAATLDDIQFSLVDTKPKARGRSGVDPVHTLKITILPVDNMAPRLEALSPVRVIEGGRVPIGPHLVNVQDLDSTMQNVAFVISRQPSFGYLENVRPSVGSENSDAAIPINSFRLADLMEETVNYVQSECRGIEPIEDSFVLYCTDGIHRSKHITFNVSIVPINDEEPIVALQNFTVSQGSNKLIDIEILNVTDLDVPSDSVLVRLQTPPHHGRITVDVDGVFGGLSSSASATNGFSELDWSDFERFAVVYKHNGNSIQKDNFTLLVTDGTHYVSRTSVIHVTPSVTVRPSVHSHLLTINHGLKDVVANDVRFIANTMLNAEAAGVSNLLIFYLVKTAPRFGVIQLYRPLRSWVNVTRGDTFTQQDIDSLSLRYFHADKWQQRDNFTFVVYANDDAVENVPVHTFVIEVKRDHKLRNITLAVEAIEVDVGGRVVLGPSVIRINAGKNYSNDLVIQVTVPPSSGYVAQAQHLDRPITNFSLADVLGSQVAYVHVPDASGNDWSSEDRFRISVFFDSNEVSPAAAVADVSVQVRRPVDGRPADRPLEPLVVPLDGSVPLKMTAYHVQGPNVAYELTEQPRYGVILLDGRPLPKLNSSFTHGQAEEGRVIYQRRPNAGYSSDLIRLQVTSVENARFQRFVDQKDVGLRLEVVVEPRKQQFLRLELNSPKTLKNFDLGVQGFAFSANHIRIVTGSNSQLSPDVHYVVQKFPKYGRLERLDGNGELQSAATEFTPADIEKKRIRYVLLDGADHATGDQFDISVVDNNRRVLALGSIELQWSVIYFMQTVYDVCEDVGKLSVPVYRLSNLDHASFVEIGVVGGTARQYEDFRLSRVQQLQFDSGVTVVSWNVGIENDGVREEDVETVIVRLRSPVNAVVRKNSDVTIRIHDKRRDSCFHSVDNFMPPNMITYDTSTVKPSSAPVCNAGTVGTPFAVTIGSSTVTLVCDGKTWVSSLQSTHGAPSTLTTTSEAPMFRRPSRHSREERMKNRELKGRKQH